jgi:hypothetical protein
MPIDDEFAIDTEEEFQAPILRTRTSSRLSLAIGRLPYVISRMTSNAATNGQ